MPQLTTDKAESHRTSYPLAYPTAALADIRRVSRQGTWLQDRVVVAHAVWEILGAAQAISIGNPDDSEIESPSDPQKLADDLYAIRELVHKGVASMRATSTPAPGSGDAIVEQSILTSARAMEATLNVALVSLAWLRKIALDQAKEMKN